MNINKNNLLVTKVASKDDSREALKCIRFTKEYTEATDGHRLVRITYPEQIKQDDLPENIKTGDAQEIKEFIIPATSTKDIKFYKGPVDFMDQAFVNVESTNANGSANFISTDLENTSSPEIKKVESQWPATDKVWPEGTPIFEVAVNAQYLEDLCNIAKSLDKDKRSNHPVIMRFFGPNLGITLEAKDFGVGQTMTALLMPVRMPE